MSTGPTIISSADEPSIDRFQYEYRNQYTRGWVRARFDSSRTIADRDAGVAAVAAIAVTWMTGTELRLVELNPDGGEWTSGTCARGTMGKS